MGIRAWVSTTTKKSGYKTGSFFLQGCSIESCWQHMRWRVRTLAWHHPLLSRFATSSQHRDSEAEFKLCGLLLQTGFSLPKLPVYCISATRLILAQQKAWWDKCSNQRGNSASKKNPPQAIRLYSFQLAQLHFSSSFKNSSRSLQPAPCRPCQGLQRNHEGSGQMGYNLQKLTP